MNHCNFWDLRTEFCLQCECREGLVYCFIFCRIRSSASKLSFYGTECGSKMTIVTVACGDRVEQSITLFQSMLLLAGCDLSFIVYTEEDDLEALRKKLNSLANAKHFRHPAINLMVKPAVYPNSTAPDGTVWKGIYMPCSTLRLFLPVSQLM